MFIYTVFMLLYYVYISSNYTFTSSCYSCVPSCTFMSYSCIFMFSNSYIGSFETNMVLCHRHHVLPKKAKRQVSANAQQHAGALWKACSAGETASRVGLVHGCTELSQAEMNNN